LGKGKRKEMGVSTQYLLRNPLKRRGAGRGGKGAKKTWVKARKTKKEIRGRERLFSTL